MSGLYPSLEDFKYDVLLHSKHHASNVGTRLRGHCSSKHADQYSLYPSFHNATYMGLDDAHSLASASTVAPVSVVNKSALLKAPLSGYTPAHKHQPSNAIKAIVLCKDSDGKVGLRLAAIQGGVFIVLVYVNSPAALAGLRFGDQVLEVNDIPVAGYSKARVHDLIKKASIDELRFAIRDRPFERIVTLHKDINGHVGFAFNKRGKIVSIVKDSSAARNGLLIEHNILEVNGQNVVGSSENDLRVAIDNCGDVIILTIMPSSIFESIVKQTDAKLLRKNMDHSVPDF